MEIDKEIAEKISKQTVTAVKAETSSESVVAELELSQRAPKRDSLGRSYGSGGRKSSSARVWIKPGTGKIVVNKKEQELYFKRPVLRMIINQPFEETNTIGNFDVFATVRGSGLSGQAGAIRNAISNALSAYDPAAFHKLLRKAGFITRDHRRVERKKYGQKKARKKFQFSKR